MKKNNIFTISTIIIFIGIIIFVMIHSIQKNNVIKNGMKIQAKIYDKKEHKTYIDGEYLYSTDLFISYEINGEQFKTKVVEDFLVSEEVGENITIYCDVNDYTNVSIAEEHGHNIIVIIFGIVCLIFIFIVMGCEIYEKKIK